MTKKTVFYFSKIGNGLYWIFVFLVLILGIIVTLSTLNLGGLRIFSVMSGSMSPKIFAGSLAIVKPYQSYRKGDVITYFPKNVNKISQVGSVTHRITEIKSENDKVLFITKGDNNPSVDSTLIESDQITGKVILSIPFIGYGASFAKKPLGFVLLIMIPAIAIIVSETLKFGNQIRYLKRRKALE